MTLYRDMMGMPELRISNPARRDRMLLISAIAMALLTLLGATGEALGYDRMLKANTVKRLLRAFAKNLTQRQALAVVFALPGK